MPLVVQPRVAEASGQLASQMLGDAHRRCTSHLYHSGSHVTEPISVDVRISDEEWLANDHARPQRRWDVTQAKHCTSCPLRLATRTDAPGVASQSVQEKVTFAHLLTGILQRVGVNWICQCLGSTSLGSKVVHSPRSMSFRVMWCQSPFATLKPASSNGEGHNFVSFITADASSNTCGTHPSAISSARKRPAIPASGKPSAICARISTCVFQLLLQCKTRICGKEVRASHAIELLADLPTRTTCNLSTTFRLLFSEQWKMDSGENLNICECLVAHANDSV